MNISWKTNEIGPVLTHGLLGIRLIRQVGWQCLPTSLLCIAT